MSVRFLFALALCLAAQLVAQPMQQPSSHVVRGVVYDSIARAPLAGAEVHVAWRDSTNPPFKTTTDANGRFRIAGIPSGQFVLGFYHESLDVLRLDAPLRAFDLSADSIVRMDIGIPSGAPVRTLRCGADRADSSDNALIAGFVRVGAGRQPVSGATVTVTWSALQLGPGIRRTVPQRAADTAGTDGMFSMCGVPAGTVLDLEVRVPGYRTVLGPVVVPDDGVLRQDVRLVDSLATNGTAELRGRVMLDNGNPVMSGRALIPALARNVPILEGAFALTELPPGTWVLEVRAIGVEPRSVVVNASESRNASLMIRVSEQARRLDAVTIVGRPNRTNVILDDVMRRQRSSFGTVFLSGSPSLRDAQHTTDVLRGARGFTVRSPGEVFGRVIGPGVRCRNIGVYVNGARVAEGITYLDAMAQPEEVLAIEAYPDVLTAPGEWRTMDGTCAIVAVWTKK